MPCSSAFCELPNGPKGFSKPVCWAAPSTIPPDTWVSTWAVPSNKLGAFFFFFFKAKLRNPNKTPVPRPCPQILIQLTEAHPVLSFLNSLDSYKGQPRSSPLTDWRVPWVRQACRRCGEQDWPAQGASSCGLLEVGHGCCWERQTMRRRIQTKSL